MIENIKLLSSDGKYWLPTTIERAENRIRFIQSPFALKDEIKSMEGSHWHGYDDEPEQIWSVADSHRNNFQLAYLMGKNPYAHWEKPIIEHTYERPLMSHQKLMTDFMLTRHYGILAADAGVGKTLSAIELMERSGSTDWWYVAPKSAIQAVLKEFEKWHISFRPKMLTYEAMRATMKKWPGGQAPLGVIFDESQRLKSWKSQRTKCALYLADAIRDEHGEDGYVFPMSGTPAPKSPVDWHSQMEIACPGFLKEGSEKAFKWRLGIFEKQQKEQGFFWDRVSWKDDSSKCNLCGKSKEEHEGINDINHVWVESINEVEFLKERLEGAVLRVNKDVLNLPDKHYRVIECEVSSTLNRVASIIAENAPTAIQALTWLRELSDGFQYREEQDGTRVCSVCNGVGSSNDCDGCGGTGNVPNLIRVAKQVPCPKEQVLVDLLDENSDQGRLVIFAGFTGSIDRITGICLKEQWDVVQVDGRGWKVLTPNGPKTHEVPLDYWSDLKHERVAFVAHPQSGGLGLTLTESRMCVFYSNDFNPDSRSQAEDRIHRKGTDVNKGATIVDIIHLPTDLKVREVLRDNRKLELLSLGEVTDVFGVPT
jgi:SNF2 family DNA or RNA helicase